MTLFKTQKIAIGQTLPSGLGMNCKQQDQENFLMCPQNFGIERFNNG